MVAPEMVGAVDDEERESPVIVQESVVVSVVLEAVADES